MKFSIQIKPIGNLCNLNCAYCYAKPFRNKNKSKIMSLNILDKIIYNGLIYSDTPTFSWHGGEPTMAGLLFFKKVIKLINKYNTSLKPINNLIQTNATLINKDWANFFYKNNFYVSISLDGPKYLHDINRFYTNAKGSFNNVMISVDILRQYNINPSVICTITKKSLPYANDIFDFFVSNNFKSIKFNPVFDSYNDTFSISDNDWYIFLKKIFFKWLNLSDISIEIRELYEIISWLNNKPLNICTNKCRCLAWISVDPDGNIYPCEYLHNELPYGNIKNTDISKIIYTDTYKKFRQLFLNMPIKCKKCNFVNLCGNGCPMTRISNNKISKDGEYVYCKSKKKLYYLIKNTFDKIKNGKEVKYK